MDKNLHECIDCEYMKSLENSVGRPINLCVCTDSPAYLTEVGICGWCEYEDDSD